MCEIEAVINSRSLTFVERSNNGPEVVTTANFIIGRSITSFPTVCAHLLEQTTSHKLQENGITYNYLILSVHAGKKTAFFNCHCPIASKKNDRICKSWSRRTNFMKGSTWDLGDWTNGSLSRSRRHSSRLRAPNPEWTDPDPSSPEAASSRGAQESRGGRCESRGTRSALGAVVRSAALPCPSSTQALFLGPQSVIGRRQRTLLFSLPIRVFVLGTSFRHCSVRLTLLPLFSTHHTLHKLSLCNVWQRFCKPLANHATST